MQGFYSNSDFTGLFIPPCFNWRVLKGKSPAPELKIIHNPIKAGYVPPLLATYSQVSSEDSMQYNTEGGFLFFNDDFFKQIQHLIDPVSARKLDGDTEDKT